jgi:hypothetical protein
MRRLRFHRRGDPVIAQVETRCRRPFPGRAVGPLGAAFLLLVIGVLLLSGVSVPLPNGSASPLQPAVVPLPRLPPSPSGPSSGCTALQAGWEALQSGDATPSVAPSLEGPCTVDHDVPGLYFVSNASDSGSRTRVVLSLPPAGSDPAASFSAFWVGLWVAGVPCSYGGASYLTVDLIPPYSNTLSVPSSANWSVAAPVWDLVAPGACDAQCQNDTAFVTIAARSYCEDDAVLSGIGAIGGAAVGQFAPGAVLSLTFDGTAGGSNPLAVYVNDSTDPGQSLAWNYSGGNRYSPGGTSYTGTVSGLPLTPLYSAAAAANGGWTGGLDLGFGWWNCPTNAENGTLPSCDSYNGPLAAVTGTPQVDLVSSWNSTTHAYSNPYPYVVTGSSSGACSGASGVAPCTDFDSGGGTGTYPSFAIDAAGGRSWWEYGGSTADAVSQFGSLATEFPSNGNVSTPVTTTVISGIHVSVGSATVNVTARVSDPYGVARVSVTSWWCTSGGLRSATTFTATRSNAPGNSPADGNWSAALPSLGFKGVFYYTWLAHSSTGAVAPPVMGNVTLSAGTSCGTTYPPPPTLAAGNISAIGGGYALTWAENASSGVDAYTVVATPTSGPATDFLEPNVTSARVSGLKGNSSYELEVYAENPAGLATVSAKVLAPEPTYYPLVARPLNVTTISTWVNSAVSHIVANITGGLEPFTFAFDFGDGTNTSVFTTSGDASVTHDFSNNYSGIARIQVVITDAVGDSVVAPVVYVTVQATPLAPVAHLSAGDSFVDVRWSAAVAPPSVPVLAYLVYWTTDAAEAPYLTAAWPTNASVPNVHRDDVQVALDDPIPVPIGTEVFVQVVAADIFGEGLLPPETAPGAEPVLAATDEGFSCSGVAVTAAGGPAPFTANFTAEYSAGAGDSLVNVTYRVVGGPAVAAPITGGDGTFWANASITFTTPGLRSVLVYAVDALSELLINTTTVYVAAAPGPVVSIAVSPTPVFANASVSLSVAASGGSGQYTVNWSLGDGETAHGLALNTSYLTAGTYLVTATVTDSVYGGTTTVTAVVPVFALPTVSIGAVPTAVADTFTLAAFANGGTGNFTYSWLFGDGSQGSGATVTHTWSSPGTYPVVVRLTDQYGHTAIGNANLTVNSPAGVTSSTSSWTSLDTLLLVLVIVLAVALLAALLVPRMRRPPPDPAAPEESAYPAPPPVEYEEERPRGVQ